MPSNFSLRETVSNAVGTFLWRAKFTSNNDLQNGVVDVMDQISDYYEEGKALFPEILFIDDLNFLEPISHRLQPIGSGELSPEIFKLIVKLCAPLAINGWLIYIEIMKEMVNYGLVSAEIDETSPSMYSQTVGDLKEGQPDLAVAYIRNIGQKVVEVTAANDKLIVSLNLEPNKDHTLNEVSKLSLALTEKADERVAVNLKTYLEKLIDQTLKAGHGNLIGVINDDNENIDNIKKNLKAKGGIYFDDPIDFAKLIYAAHENRDSESSVQLRLNASLLSAMLNHDGITIMTNKGRVIGYHLLIDVYEKDGDTISGGSRSRAHLSMINCEMFEFCFYKSQDGNLKIWKNE